MDYMKQKAKRHLSGSWWAYLFVGLFFAAGLVFGALGVSVLDAETNSALGDFVNQGISQLNNDLSFVVTTKQAIAKNLVNLGKIFFLGLTVVGFPLILISIFTRGFALGFTVVFLIREKALRGGALVLFAVLPPNLLSLPAYFLAAVSAINFTLYLIRGRDTQRNIPITQYFLGYLVMMFLFGLLVVSAAFIEGYLSPLMIRLLSG